VPPPPAACGGGTTICGKISAAEDATIALGGVVVEYRDVNGVLRKTTRTGPDGAYNITPSAGPIGYVSVAPGRNQSAAPTQKKLSAVGEKADFAMLGAPAVVKVRNANQGTFVLITPNKYDGPGKEAPPPIDNPGGKVPAKTYTAVADYQGQVDISVRYGTYYITCWRPVASGALMSYVKSESKQVADGATLKPNTVKEITCPKE